MEQAREEPQQHEEKPPSAPLRCPRCDSLDTKFRYFNNHSLAQPRHYCKSCKRQWTVGGSIRNIPVGGKTRNGKPTKAVSSRGDNPRHQSTQPLLPLGEEHQQNLHFLTAMVSQNFDRVMFQPVTHSPSAESPLESYCFNNEISCLDAIQSLIQPEINNQQVDMGSHLRSGANITIPQEWNVQTMASEQAIPQEIPRNNVSNQTHNEAIKASLPHLYRNRVVQPPWPMNSLPHDITNDSSFTTSNAHLSNNFSSDATNTEDTTSVNVDEWLNFPKNDLL